MPPFTILHLCMGNICRSPLAERLLALALQRRVGHLAEKLYVSHSAGVGGWHETEPMYPGSARELRARGGSVEGFRARKVTGAMIDTSNLILCATSEQVAHVESLRADAVHRTFVLGEFGRLLGGVDLRALPPAADTPDAAYERGVALVAAIDAARDGRARHADDLPDPWGMPDREFARTADRIELTTTPLAAALTGCAE
jgi:protein-tyrosine phosphatase